MSDEPLEALAVWDQPSLMKRLMGKATLKDKLVKLFVQDYPVRQKQLEEALAAGDLEPIASAAHALKGMAGNISGLRLQALSSSIETAAKAGDADTINALAPQLPGLGQELMQALEADMNGGAVPATPAASGDKVQVKVDELTDTLNQLQGKLARGEFIDLNGIPLLATCSQKPVSLVSEAGEQVLEANLVKQASELCQMIERFDFQPAISVVDGMLQLVAGERG